MGGLFVRPRAARALLVLAHGAAAGIEHPFMGSIAEALAERGIATLRYRFPYVEAGRKNPDPGAVLVATARSAAAFAARLVPTLRRFAGGKSMGGRMTSRAAATGPGIDAEGIVFFGFPLHASGRPGVVRAEHLAHVRQPMLFFHGTRDPLARLETMGAVCTGLAERATLHVVEGADHGFHVPKRSGRHDAAVIEEMAEVTRAWNRGAARSQASTTQELITISSLSRPVCSLDKEVVLEATGLPSGTQGRRRCGNVRLPFTPVWGDPSTPGNLSSMGRLAKQSDDDGSA